MLSKRLRRCLAVSVVAAAAVTAVGAAASPTTDVDCLATVAPITSMAGATLGYSVKAVRGEDAQNCNLLHLPVKLVDVNNGRAPVHPTVGISFQHKTQASFSALVRSERKLAQKHNGFMALGGLGPLATLIHSPIDGDAGLVILTYVHGKYMSISIGNGATPVSVAQAVALAHTIAARI